MIKAIAIALIVMLLVAILAGCQSAPVKPVDAKCSPLCGTSCQRLPDWDGKLASAPDTLARYGDLYQQCAARGQACRECINRLRDAKVIQ
jgi:hypothetical protein